jgi:hypothetical protein
LLRVQAQLRLMAKGNAGIGRHPAVTHVARPAVAPGVAVLARALGAGIRGGLGEHHPIVREGRGGLEGGSRHCQAQAQRQRGECLCGLHIVPPYPY